MEKLLVLRLPPRRSRLIYYQIYIVFFMFGLRDILHFPSAITYLTDLVMLSICLSKFVSIKKSISVPGKRIQLGIILLIFVFMLFSAFVNMVNPLLVLWAIRNDLRFFAFFVVCISLMNLSDISKIMRFIMTMFWANVILCSIQYFAFGIKNDNLGGFFGITKGCNTYINILICIVCIYVIVRFMNRGISPWVLSIHILASLYLASLCELKVVYVEIVFVFAFAIITQKPSIKTVVTVFLGLGLGVIGIRFASIYFPDILELFLDREAQLYYLAGNGYTNAGDLNRFTAIGQIYEMFFKENLLSSLIGFGTGSCEYSNFTFLQSDFAKNYSYLHYRWFSHAWIYLEQGAIGLGLYILFFLSIVKKSINYKNKENKEWLQFSLLFMPICLFSMIYNCAIQTEAGYIMAFACSFPFVMSNQYWKRRVVNGE